MLLLDLNIVLPDVILKPDLILIVEIKHKKPSMMQEKERKTLPLNPKKKLPLEFYNY
jgi:hypothetical protein